MTRAPPCWAGPTRRSPVIDEHVFRWFNHLADRTPWLHGAATTYADWGIVLFGALLLLAWWDARSADDAPAAVAAVAWAGVAMLLGALAVQLIGAPIDRARPTAVLSGTHLLLSPTSDFSFPSDHSTATAAIAMGLLIAGPRLRRRWYGVAAAVLALAMAVVRVYVGAHYPTDVLAGLALGSVVAGGLAIPGTRLITLVTRWLAASPLAWSVSSADERRPVGADPTS